jgi:hypothetical protein
MPGWSVRTASAIRVISVGSILPLMRCLRPMMCYRFLLEAAQRGEVLNLRQWPIRMPFSAPSKPNACSSHFTTAMATTIIRAGGSR